MEIKIKEVIVRERKEWKKRKKKTGVFFFVENEKLMDNLINRKSRPYNEYRKLLPEVLEKAGLEVQKGNWNQYAGCSCPCSPGFLLQQDIGKDIYVTIE